MAARGKSLGAVAPKERINISYRPATGDARESVELPFKMLVLGDFTKRALNEPVEDRQPTQLNSYNFDQVMSEHELKMQFSVQNQFSADKDAHLDVDLTVNSLADFEPDSLVQNIPLLNDIYQLREALKALKGPLGNSPQMRRYIQTLLSDEKQLKAAKKELGIN